MFCQGKYDEFFPTTPEVPKQLKDLLIGMFNPNPEQRNSLEQIEKSEWLTQKDDEEEVKEMKGKIEKECQRLDKIREGSMLLWAQ